jgi:glyoxylase-like metal-dependent hydrolase (beta-lactamase superfamily II)
MIRTLGTEFVHFYLLEQDGELDVPGRLRVIHTPGHTEGQCVLYAPFEGQCVLYAPFEDALFVGDAVNNIDIVPTASKSSQCEACRRAAVR